MRYSEPVDRFLSRSNAESLRTLHPSEILRVYAGEVQEVRQATDSELAGGQAVGPLFPAVRSGLFYRFDALDDAHRLVQDLPGEVAAYWHGMIHRREADYDNARYWFRRAGALPIFGALHGAASFSPEMARQFTWEPYLLTHLFEQKRFGGDGDEAELAKLQQVEFDHLFDYTWRQSVPPGG